MSCLIQLAKHGDLLSVLPILHHELLTTGIKPKLVVARAYRHIPESVDYLEPVIFDGDMQDLEGAIKYAKSQFDDVRVTQLHGRDFKFQHRHPSFQYDQWDRAGYLDKWDELPLILPRQNNGWSKATVNLLTESPSFILYADHSQSSPFFYKEELAELLVQSFPQHQVVRLSSVLASSPSELLALMDAADLIVAVDSMPLHLSKACRTPVIALVSDYPSRWQGSAWSRRYAMHCRYGDYPHRATELVRAARAAMAGSLLKATGFATEVHGYNPSIIRYGNQTLTTFRYHPARGWKTRLAINDGARTSDILMPPELAEFSHEDARLFAHQGKLMMTYVLGKELPVSRLLRCVVGYGMLTQREGRWKLERHYQPVFQNNDWTGMVKNWCPFEHDSKIHFIFGNQFGEQIVIQVDGEKVTKEFKSPEAKWKYGEIRGGAIVKHGDNFLRFFHSRTGGAHWAGGGQFRYYVGALLMSAHPPFNVMKVAEHPLLSGDERYAPNCFHWKPNVVIPYGAVTDGDTITLSVGRNDCVAESVNLKNGDLEL